MRALGNRMKTSNPSLVQLEIKAEDAGSEQGWEWCAIDPEDWANLASLSIGGEIGVFEEEGKEESPLSGRDFAARSGLGLLIEAQSPPRSLESDAKVKTPNEAGQVVRKERQSREKPSTPSTVYPSAGE